MMAENEREKGVSGLLTLTLDGRSDVFVNGKGLTNDLYIFIDAFSFKNTKTTFGKIRYSKKNRPPQIKCTEMLEGAVNIIIRLCTKDRINRQFKTISKGLIDIFEHDMKSKNASVDKELILSPYGKLKLNVVFEGMHDLQLLQETKAIMQKNGSALSPLKTRQATSSFSQNQNGDQVGGTSSNRNTSNGIGTGHNSTSNSRGGQHMFGHPLESQAIELTRFIPPVVIKSIEQIEQHGMDKEGIYRISGNKIAIDSLKNRLDQYDTLKERTRNVDLNLDSARDPNGMYV